MTQTEDVSPLPGTNNVEHWQADSAGRTADGVIPCCSQGELPKETSQRRVTFSDDNMVHHIPQRSTSSVEDDSFQDTAGPVYQPEPPRGLWAAFQQRVKALKRDLTALYYALHHPDTPWYSRVLPWLVLAYALSPLDLIPDFIPVLGILDDMLLLPLGLWLSYKLIPVQVMAECRDRAHREPLLLHQNWLVATLIFLLWTCSLLWLVHWLVTKYAEPELVQHEFVMLAAVGGFAVLLFVAWLVSSIPQEARRRHEWEVSLLPEEPHDCSSDEAEALQEGPVNNV